MLQNWPTYIVWFVRADITKLEYHLILLLCRREITMFGEYCPITSRFQNISFAQTFTWIQLNHNKLSARIAPISVTYYIITLYSIARFQFTKDTIPYGYMYTWRIHTFYAETLNEWTGKLSENMEIYTGWIHWNVIHTMSSWQCQQWIRSCVEGHLVVSISSIFWHGFLRCVRPELPIPPPHIEYNFHVFFGKHTNTHTNMKKKKIAATRRKNLFTHVAVVYCGVNLKWATFSLH